MDWHPVADMFPLLTGPAFDELAADVRANGVREPVVTFRGTLIDGRNRWRAAQAAGVPCPAREWDGDEAGLVPYVLSLNLHRRHLDESQRAMVAAKVANLKRGDNQHTEVSGIPLTSQADAAALLSVSVDSVKAAKAVRRNGVPELVKAAEAGKVSVSAAAAVADAPPDEQREVVARGEAEIVAKAKEIKARKAERLRAEREARRLADLAARAAAAPAAGPAWRVEAGDCLGLLAKVKPGSATLVFADPPYNLGFDYGHGHDDSLPDAEYVAWVRRWVDLCVRALAPDGSLWALISDEYAAEYAAALKGAGLVMRNWVVWYETFGVNCGRQFNRTKRHLLYFARDPGRVYFDPAAVSRPSARQVVYNDGRAAAAGKLWDDVWAIPRLPGTAAERVPGFPTQLPLELLLPVVGCATRPGDLVLDPFCGSGTAGAAAVRLGRRYVGFERNPAFARLARLRLKGERREAG